MKREGDLNHKDTEGTKKIIEIEWTRGALNHRGAEDTEKNFETRRAQAAYADTKNTKEIS
ncbi:hypothetical protein UFO1_4205 [Pelosinus sp. UFO1]|nr:hypothetical protein UFO1_4205 [Pelosinus sp. UFO1]